MIYSQDDIEKIAVDVLEVCIRIAKCTDEVDDVLIKLRHLKAHPKELLEEAADIRRKVK